MAFEFSDQQLQAIEMMKKQNVGVLIGGPGTGKTTTVKAIIDWAKTCNLKVLLAAPTGKAAKRMMETTGAFASTIHSMLGCEVHREDSFKFIHNQNKQLRADLIVIDEISMITTELMSNVLEAIRVGTKVLFVGDQNQLPSVGAGAVLRDIIESKVIPIVELDTIHRNTGYIVEACNLIKKGQLYNPHRIIDYTQENPINLIHIERTNHKEVLSAIENIVTIGLPGKKIPGIMDNGFDPHNDIQILSPVNTTGDLSCFGINRHMRGILNPLNPEQQREQDDSDNEYHEKNKKGRAEEGNTKAKLLFFVGDKVIQTKNDQLRGETFNQKQNQYISGSVPIVNGDIGKIIDIDKKNVNIFVKFSDPDRIVKMSRKSNDLLHAYCITCHKFQGSEAPAIVFPVVPAYSFMMYNAWIYTAISRAKVACITVGSFKAIEKAIKNIRPNVRETRLKNWLRICDTKVKQYNFGDL